MKITEGRITSKCPSFLQCKHGTTGGGPRFTPKFEWETTKIQATFFQNGFFSQSRTFPDTWFTKDRMKALQHDESCCRRKLEQALMALHPTQTLQKMFLCRCHLKRNWMWLSILRDVRAVRNVGSVKIFVYEFWYLHYGISVIVNWTMVCISALLSFLALHLFGQLQLRFPIDVDKRQIPNKLQSHEFYTMRWRIFAVHSCSIRTPLKMWTRFKTAAIWYARQVICILEFISIQNILYN